MLDNKKAQIKSIFPNSKRGQIGETITWIIATLVIVVVLSISILATFSVSNKKMISLDDKEKDFIATKSITNFLRNNDSIKLITNLKEDSDETKIRNFLETLSKPSKFIFRGWNLEIDYIEETKRVSTYIIITDIFEQDDSFEIKMFSEQINLRFWAKCVGGFCK